MGLGWAGFLQGAGQGLEKASGAVDQYTAQKKLAQQLAMQQAQQDHMIAQDSLAQQRYLEQVQQGKDRDKRADDLMNRQITNEDLTNMNQDSLPMTSLPAAMQANVQKYAPTQLSQPTSQSTTGYVQGLPPGQSPQGMGFSDTTSMQPGPKQTGDDAPPIDPTGMAPGASTTAPNNFGPQMVNRYVTPGERNAKVASDRALGVADIQHRLDQARIDAANDRNANTVGGRYDVAMLNQQRMDAARQAKDDAATEKRRMDAGRFGFSQASTGYDRWLKNEYANDPLNQYNQNDLKGHPELLMSLGKLKPPSADMVAAKKLELFQNAVGAAGFAPSDYPDILNKMGIDNGQPPAPGAPAPAPALARPAGMPALPQGWQNPGMPSMATPGQIGQAQFNQNFPAPGAQAQQSAIVRLVAPDGKTEMDVPRELAAGYIAKGAKIKQ